MGHRTVKRVLLDFSWPLNKVWKGYVNSHPESIECPACEGTGQPPRVKQLAEDFYDHNGGWRYEHGIDPDGNPADRPPWKIIGETRRWCDQITQDEVLALVNAGRLYEFVRTFVPGEGWLLKKWETKGWFCEGCLDAVPQLSPEHYSCHCTGCDRDMILLECDDLRLLMPRAEEVNARERKGGMDGHDAINRWILIKTRAKRLGIWGRCGRCCGYGELPYPDKRIRRKARRWQEHEPPTGPGWQLWSTTSEGCPITPVFETAELLAVYCSISQTILADEMMTVGEWMQFITGKEGVEIGSFLVGTSSGYVGSFAHAF